MVKLLGSVSASLSEEVLLRSVSKVIIGPHVGAGQPGRGRAGADWFLCPLVLCDGRVIFGQRRADFPGHTRFAPDPSVPHYLAAVPDCVVGGAGYPHRWFLRSDRKASALGDAPAVGGRQRSPVLPGVGGGRI